MRACVKFKDRQTSFSRRKYFRIHNRRKFSNILSNVLTRALFLIGIFEVTNFLTYIGISTILHEFLNFYRNFQISLKFPNFYRNFRISTGISLVLYENFDSDLPLTFYDDSTSAYSVVIVTLRFGNDCVRIRFL